MKEKLDTVSIKMPLYELHNIAQVVSEVLCTTEILKGERDARVLGYCIKCE